MLSGLVQYSDDSDDDVNASEMMKPLPPRPEQQRKALPSAKDLLAGAKPTPAKKRSTELPAKEHPVSKWQKTDPDELLMVPPQMRSGRPNIVTEESLSNLRRKKTSKQ